MIGFLCSSSCFSLFGSKLLLLLLLLGMAPGEVNFLGLAGVISSLGYCGLLCMDSVVVEGTPKDTSLVRVYVPILFETSVSYPFKSLLHSICNGNSVFTLSVDQNVICKAEDLSRSLHLVGHYSVGVDVEKNRQ